MTKIYTFLKQHGMECLASDMFFKYKTDNRTRGHSWTSLVKERCQLDKRKYMVSQRTIND